MPRTSDINAKNTATDKMSLISIFKGILAAYIITIPAFMLFALILSNTDFPQRLISPAVVVTTVLSVLIAGSVSTRGIRNRGWLNGSFVGMIYMLILYIFSSLILKSFTIDKYVITMTVIGVLTGAIGGIVGINIKKDSKYKYIGS